MQISAIVARFDSLKKNNYTLDVKLGWVNHVDGDVWDNVCKHAATVALAKSDGAYNLPAGVTFGHLLKVFLDGEEIFKANSPATTGYHSDPSGKIIVYPDATGAVEISHKVPFTPHAAATEQAFIPAPYDKVYDDYLSAMVDKYNREFDLYNSSMKFYNASFDEYAAWYKDQKED